MTIDNSKYVLKYRKYTYLMLISLTAFIPVFLIVDFFSTPVLGLSKEMYVIALSVIFVLFHTYRHILDLNSIQISDSGGKLIVKYYSLRPFAGKHKTIEIPLASLAKYTIQSTFWGQKPSLVLFQKIQGKLAKYPPLSLSAMKKGDVAKLQNRLDELIQRN